MIAKRLEDAYRPGERAMLKVKQHRTADCVVGGFRRAKDGPLVASLLLGLYDEAGRLNHVGFTSGLAKQDRPELTERLEALIGPAGFTGKVPGGPKPLERRQGERVVPIETRSRRRGELRPGDERPFRHGTGLVRRRPDKVPRQCCMEQLDYALRPSDLGDID